MKITFIHHSGFLIEAANCAVVIDYWKDTPQNMLRTFLQEEEKRIDQHQRPIYVLSSHFHADHYNPEILTWREHYKKLKFEYVLSSDIRRRKKIAQENQIGIQFLRRGDTYNNEYIKIQAGGSTDAGICFYLELEGKRLFHAGDLNNWHWQDESSVEEAKKAEQAYISELNYLVKSLPSQEINAATPFFFDAIFFPVDPRIGSDFYKGALQFIEKFPTRLFLPMHFWEEYNRLPEFAQEVSSKCQVKLWTTQGESINLI
ncbi:MAG: MBL fold metallo-hydrolase [Bacteroidaceae bacterium]